MKVLFLCGGIGRRMFPITEDKFLLRFLGKTLLEHQFDVAIEAGLNEFLIVANKGNKGRIEEILAATSGIHAELVVQENPDGIANALESARHLLNGEVIIANPNDVFETSGYLRLLESHRANHAVAHLLAHEVSSYFPGGYITVNSDNELLGIVEKPGEGNEPSSMINVLVHLHTDPELLLHHISGVHTDNDDAYERSLDSIISDGRTIRAVPYPDRWTPIKYPWHILAVVRHFLDGVEGWIAPSAKISESAVIDGKVIIAEGARVLENAVIRGPAYVGRNTVIGNNTLVRDYSHIGADCVVGFGTEVKDSYLGDRTWTHMSYLGDSIIGDDCNFGAGTVTANWRFDEKDVSVMRDDGPVNTGMDKLGAIIGNGCHTGINVSIMPGVTVGAGSIIGPHVNLTAPVDADSMVFDQSVNRTIQKTRSVARDDIAEKTKEPV